MPNTYPVTILTDSTVKGNVTATTVRARHKDEAMDQILMILGLGYGDVEKVVVWPCKEEL